MLIKNFLLLILLALFIFNGCSSLRDSGEDLSEGLINPIKDNADTIGYDIVKGMRESLTSEESKRAIAALLDSIISTAGKGANRELTGIRDSVLDDYIVKWLQDSLLGNRTAERLVYIRNSFLDTYLKEYISDLSSSVGNNIINDSTIIRVSALRDSLLGETTNLLLTKIIDSAIVGFSSRFDSHIKPRLDENVGFLEKNATWILILIGIIALVIIWFVWRQKEKYLRLTKVLTYQIAEVPDKNLKENLKTNISKNAKTIGVEDDLRTVLDKYGLLHKS